MAVRRDPRAGQWRYQKVVRLPDGTRTRISGTPTISTKLEAEKAEREHIARVLNPQPARREAPTFDAWADEFMATYARSNNRPSERQTKESILEHHLRPTVGRKRLDEISTRDVEALKARLLDSGKSEKTVNNILACLGKILRYAAEVGVLAVAPRIRLLKVPPQKFDFLTFEEYDRLLGTIGDDASLRAMMVLGAEAGLRRGEILALEWGDVDLNAGTLTVRRAVWHDGDREHVGPPKNGRDRRIPLSQRLGRALRAVRHLQGERIFSERSGRLTPKRMESALTYLCKRAGMRRIGWHVLRHTFCSHLAVLNASPKVIQELAGHSTLTMTLRYMHLAPGAHREAVALLDARRANHVQTTNARQ